MNERSKTELAYWVVQNVKVKSFGLIWRWHHSISFLEEQCENWSNEALINK